MNGALGYNCYFLIVDAIKRAGSAEPQAIAKALGETKGLPTALGTLSINKNHDAEMPWASLNTRTASVCMWVK